MTAEKSTKKDTVAAEVEKLEEAASSASKKTAPADDAVEATAETQTTAEKKKAAPKKKATAAKKSAAKKKPAKKAKKQQLRITQIKSQIGFDASQRKVLAGLGLGRIGKQAVRVDDPCIRGMVAKVSHLVSVEEVEA
jgi:large subunit ribosomal protein L30